MKQATSTPVIAVGLITEPEQAEAILAAGEADAIAIARAALYDPRWPWHAAAEARRAGRARRNQYWRSQPREFKDLFVGACDRAALRVAALRPGANTSRREAILLRPAALDLRQRRDFGVDLEPRRNRCAQHRVDGGEQARTRRRCRGRCPSVRWLWSATPRSASAISGPLIEPICTKRTGVASARRAPPRDQQALGARTPEIVEHDVDARGERALEARLQRIVVERSAKWSRRRRAPRALQNLGVAAGRDHLLRPQMPGDLHARAAPRRRWRR